MKLNPSIFLKVRGKTETYKKSCRERNILAMTTDHICGTQYWSVDEVFVLYYITTQNE